jgi:hypothetical protein
MKTISAIIIAIILLIASLSTATVFANEGVNEGYSVDDGYPVVTETTTEPTDPPPDPTEPTPEPTKPTPKPPEPTAKPPEPTAKPPKPTAKPPNPTEFVPAPTEEPDVPNPICGGIMLHPVILRIAERYNLAYEELVTYFCEYDLGVGELNLAIETFMRASNGITLEEILAMRTVEGLDWGEIWQNMGLVGSENGEGDGFGPTEGFRFNNWKNNPQGTGNNGGDTQ